MADGSIKFPSEYIKEISMSAFENVIRRLKAQGDELADLADAADAAFLVWQLAEDPSGRAQQTICESLPILLNAIYEVQDE